LPAKSSIVEQPQEVKVFCFFFSKKKAFLSLRPVAKNLCQAGLSGARLERPRLRIGGRPSRHEGKPQHHLRATILYRQGGERRR
jgi:hypothetical protein